MFALCVSTGVPVLGQVDVTGLPVLSVEKMEGTSRGYRVADVERTKAFGKEWVTRFIQCCGMRTG